MKNILLAFLINCVFVFPLNAQTKVAGYALNVAETNPYFNYKGKLIIVGGGSMPDSLFEFFAAHCGGKNEPIVYIPTATKDEKYIQEGGHLVKFTSRGFTNLSTIHTRDKAKADAPEFIALMRKAKGIFFGGGDQDLIAEAYGGTQLYQEMLALLDRGGVIMGTSAGATIMGALLVGGDARKDLTKYYSFKPAFSFIQKVDIDQHVLVRNRQFDLIPVIESNPTHLGVAIDESTAIIVEGNQFKVWGNSYVMVYDAKDWANQKAKWGKVVKPFTMLSSGQVFDLTTQQVKK
jgi:cyanophycinase